MFSRLSLLSLAAILLLATAPAQAQDAAATRIAVVNVQLIMRDSLAAKSVREQLEAKQKAFQNDLAKKEEALQKEDQELSKQRNALSKEAFEKKAQEFRSKATSAQKEVAAKKATLDGAFDRALGDIQKAVGDIITSLSKEKNFAMAIPTSQILYADPALDITEEVLKRLDKSLPKVDVKFEAPKKEEKQ